jgi:hypothetical protein
MAQINSSRAANLCDAVAAELGRAMIQHGPMHSAHEAYAVILEELEEFWWQVKINPKKLSPEAQNDRLIEMRKELLQVAAMAVRAIVDLNL